jgi:hypothetical protein
MRDIMLQRVMASREVYMKKLFLSVLMLALVGTSLTACGGGGGTGGPKSPSGLYKASEVWANGTTMDFQAGKKVVYQSILATRTYNYSIDKDNRIKMENSENGIIDYAQYTPETDTVLYAGVTFVK